MTGLELANAFLIGRRAKANELVHGQTVLLERQNRHRDGVGSQCEGLSHILLVFSR